MSTIAEEDGLEFDLYQNHRFQIVCKCFGLRGLPAVVSAYTSLHLYWCSFDFVNRLQREASWVLRSFILY